MSEIGNTNFPDGPPLGVSYFPVGKAGASMAGTDYTGNITGKPAYKQWSKYISNVATQVGYKFLNFLGAEDAIDSTKNAPTKPEALVQENALTKEWWKNHINENIVTEAKANTHLTHLEELLLTRGFEGYKMAKSFLIELVKNLRGNSDAKVNTTVKWDGAPAMFVGTNPDNGQFFVGTKSVFTQNPKLVKSASDLDKFGYEGDLRNKIAIVLRELPKLGIQDVLQGDLMYIRSD